MTRDEAVDLLNSVLNKNGYAAIRNGRTLTIVGKNDAKTRNIPVKTSNDPDSIPDNAEIVTQIIPIRFVEARQLVSDLSSFVSPQATIVANEAGNSIVVTDTQSNIRHLTEIIRAIDNSAEGETEIRVFHLTHASPADVANELGQIFPSSTSGTGNNQSPIRFGGGGFGRFGGGGGGFGGFPGFGGGGGGGGNAAGNGQNARVQKQSQVLAVADLRTSSVIVTASKDLMQEIAGMMEQLDVSSTRDQKVFVYHMDNGDPQQTLQVLQSMFGGNNTSRTGTGSSSQNSALMNRATQNATTGGTSTTTTGSGAGGGNTRGAGGGAAF
jgi:type II secretory pathway component GspD/PulD (secretin)